MMSTVDHEYNHLVNNAKWIAEAKKHGYDGLFKEPWMPGKAYVEARNYQLGLEQGRAYGYSPNIMRYYQTQLKKMPWVIQADIGFLY